MASYCRYVGLALPLLLVVLLGYGADGVLRKPPVYDDVHPLAYSTSPQMILYWGYPSETHKTTTEDGYEVVMHRIPWGKSGPPKQGEKRPVVLLGHGLFGTSELWLSRSGKDGLVFILADLGYDIWLANYRGSYYSLKHKKYNTRENKFWDFGWHENGVYDTPSMIDYILKLTKEDSLAFIGHSMGSSAQLVFLSERPDYQDKVRANFLLAPSVTFSDLKGAAKYLSTYLPPIINIAETSHAASPMPFMQLPRPVMCVEKSAKNSFKFREACVALLDTVSGPLHTTNQTTLMGLVYHWPAGVSLGQLLHYGQLITHPSTMNKFDYGPERNKREYGSVTPPPYDLSKITSPVYIYYGETDYMANGKDIERISKNIPSLKLIYKIPSAKFNHIDFVTADDAKELVYEKLISDMLPYKY